MSLTQILWLPLNQNILCNLFLSMYRPFLILIQPDSQKFWMFCVTNDHIIELYWWAFYLCFLMLMKGYCYCFSLFIINVFFWNHSVSLCIVSFIFLWSSLSLLPVINMLALSAKKLDVALQSLQKLLVESSEVTGLFRFTCGLRKMASLTCYVRFEVFTAVTMKNSVFWNVAPCGSCNYRRFGGT
jgi:hypothetical protein